jgi:hypothetical protein
VSELRPPDSRPEYLRPGLRLTVVDRKSDEERSVVISSAELNDRGKRWRHGNARLIANGALNRRDTRAGRPQGWPVFTQRGAPPYELLPSALPEARTPLGEARRRIRGHGTISFKRNTIPGFRAYCEVLSIASPFPFEVTLDIGPDVVDRHIPHIPGCSNRRIISISPRSSF